MNPIKDSSKKCRIAIFSASTQGFYFGEIINQIRSLCFIKGYHLTIVNTTNHGEFDLALSVHQFDAVIIIKNALSNRLAEQYLETQKIPCVSIGYDYFPIKIPVISSDHETGVRLAMDHLTRRGCSKIAFVGDLSQYDIRKRYEAYCDVHDELGQEVSESYLFNVDNADFTGGNRAADEFIQNNCDADGVITGAGLTGVGFYQKLNKLSASTASALQYVCFDTISLIPVFTPKLFAVDPNIHLVAYKSLNVLESMLKDELTDSIVKVEPKLISVSENAESSYDEFLATCVDLPEVHNPNYMKAIIANIHEWPKEIVASGLDQIMSIAPIFEKYMGACALSKFHVDAKDQQWIKLLKVFTPEGIIQYTKEDRSSYFKAEQLSAESIASNAAIEKQDVCCHFTICVNGRPWGFLSALGNTATATPASSFLAYTGYMESIRDLFGAKLSPPAATEPFRTPKQETGNNQQQVDPQATIEWDYTNRITTWSKHALGLLGYESKIETNIYQNMDITDRLTPDQIPKTREALSRLVEQQHPINITTAIKLKTGKFAAMILQGELDTQSTPSVARFCIGITDDVEDG